MSTERERLTCQRNLDLETSTTQSIYKMNKSSFPNPHKLTVLPSVWESKPWLKIFLVFPNNFFVQIKSIYDLEFHWKHSFMSDLCTIIIALTPYYKRHPRSARFPVSHKTINGCKVSRLNLKKLSTRRYTAQNLYRQGHRNIFQQKKVTVQSSLTRSVLRNFGSCRLTYGFRHTRIVYSTAKYNTNSEEWSFTGKNKWMSDCHRVIILRIF